jgi:hypothetical protein
MRSGAWLALLGLALGPAAGACSGGYPLPPTRCDDWCDVTKAMQCEDYYEPAGCVSQCEQGHLSAEECRPQMDAVLSCFRATPGATKQLCVYTPISYDNVGAPPMPYACQLEAAALTECVGFLLNNNFQR